MCRWKFHASWLGPPIKRWLNKHFCWLNMYLGKKHTDQTFICFLELALKWGNNLYEKRTNRNRLIICIMIWSSFWLILLPYEFFSSWIYAYICGCLIVNYELFNHLLGNKGCHISVDQDSGNLNHMFMLCRIYI